LPNRILVVEDEPLIALDIEEAVADANCLVVGNASTTADALAMLEKVPCDGVILDANLAGQSAAPIVEWLKSAGVPFIVVSGYARSQLDFLDDSAVLVGKPFNFDELTQTVRTHLGG